MTELNNTPPELAEPTTLDTSRENSRPVFGQPVLEKPVQLGLNMPDQRDPNEAVQLELGLPDENSDQVVPEEAPEATEMKEDDATQPEIQANKLSITQLRELVAKHLKTEDPQLQERFVTVEIYFASLIDINRANAEGNISMALQISELFQYTPEQADTLAAEIMAAVKAAEANPEVDTVALENQLVSDLSVSLEQWSAKIMSGPRRSAEKKLSLLEQRKRGVWRRLKMDSLKTTNRKLYNRYNGVIRFRLGQKINLLKRTIEVRQIETDMNISASSASTTETQESASSDATTEAATEPVEDNGDEGAVLDEAMQSVDAVEANSLKDVDDFLAELGVDTSIVPAPVAEGAEAQAEPQADSESATEPAVPPEPAETPADDASAIPEAPSAPVTPPETAPTDASLAAAVERGVDQDKVRTDLRNMLALREFKGLFDGLSAQRDTLDDFITKFLDDGLKDVTKETAEANRIAVLKIMHEKGVTDEKFMKNDVRVAQLNEFMDRVFGKESGANAVIDTSNGEWKVFHKGEPGYDEARKYVPEYKTKKDRLFARMRGFFKGNRLPTFYDTPYERSVAAGKYDELEEYQRATDSRYAQAAENNPDYVATASPDKRRATWKRRLWPALVVLALALTAGVSANRSSEISTNNVPTVEAAPSSPDDSPDSVDGAGSGGGFGGNSSMAEAAPVDTSVDVFMPIVTNGGEAAQAAEGAEAINAQFGALLDHMMDKIESGDAAMAELVTDEAEIDALKVYEQQPDGTYNVKLTIGSGEDQEVYVIKQVPEALLESLILNPASPAEKTTAAPVESTQEVEETAEVEKKVTAEAESGQENVNVVEFAAEHPWAYYKEVILNDSENFMVISNDAPSEAILANIKAAQEAGKIVVVGNTNLPQETNAELLAAGAIPIGQIIDGLKDWHNATNLFVDGAYNPDTSIVEGAKVLEIPDNASVYEIRDLANEQGLPVVFSEDQAKRMAVSYAISLLTPSEDRTEQQAFEANELNAHPTYGGDADAALAIDILQKNFNRFAEGVEAATKSTKTVEAPSPEDIEPPTPPEAQTITVEPVIATPVSPGAVTVETDLDQPAEQSPDYNEEDATLNAIKENQGADVVNQVKAFAVYDEGGSEDAAKLADVFDIINDSTENKLLQGERLSVVRQILQDAADGEDIDWAMGKAVYEQLLQIKDELEGNPDSVDGIVGSLGRKISTENQSFAKEHLTYLYENNRFNEISSTIQAMIEAGNNEWFGFATGEELNQWYNSELKPALEAGDRAQIGDLLEQRAFPSN